MAHPGRQQPGPPQGEGRSRSWQPLCLILAVVGGCGCVVVILAAVGIIGGLSWSLFSLEEHGVEQPAPDEAGPGGPGGEVWEPEGAPEAPLPDAQPPGHDRPAEPGVASQPGADAAMDFARTRRSDWQATITGHSDDWHTVRLAMKPPDSDEWTTWLELQWSHALQAYILIDEGPIAVEDGGEEIPDIYRPGEQVAVEAALGYAEQPDWVAKVVRSSADWRTATLWVGPPASEWVWEIKLQWNDSLQCYELVSMEAIE